MSDEEKHVPTGEEGDPEEADALEGLLGKSSPPAEKGTDTSVFNQNLFGAPAFPAPETPEEPEETADVEGEDPDEWEWIEGPMDEIAFLEEAIRAAVAREDELPVEMETLKATKSKEGPQAVKQAKQMIDKLDGVEEGFLDASEIIRGMRLLVYLVRRVEELTARIEELEARLK